MSSPKSNPQTPPTHSRVTFQSTPNSAANSTHSSNDVQTSPNLELSKEEVSENNLTQLFTKGFLVVLTSKEAVLKEERDCILQNNAQRCKEVNTTSFPIGGTYMSGLAASASTNVWQYHIQFRTPFSKVSTSPTLAAGVSLSLGSMRSRHTCIAKSLIKLHSASLVLILVRTSTP